MSRDIVTMSPAGGLEVMFHNSTEQNTTGAEDWTDVYEAVRWIQLVMAVMSLLGSASIIVYATSQSIIWTPELQPLFLLSVADLLLALSWLIGASLFTANCDSHTNCYHLHTVEQILYMASFFYTLNYVWALYTWIKRRFYCHMNEYTVECPTTVSTASKITAFVSGVLPVLLMTPAFIQGNIGHCYDNFSQPYKCLLMHTGALFQTSEATEEPWECSLDHYYRIAVFLATFVFTFTGIVVLMGKARHFHRRVVISSGYLGDRQRASFRVVDRQMFLYPSVFIFCWGPAAYVAAMMVINPTAVQGLPGVILYITQAFTSGSQGFLNCLVYGWTHKHFRSASRNIWSRDVGTQTPLLSSQKRCYQALRTTG